MFLYRLYIYSVLYYTRENQDILYVYPGIASHYVGVAKLYLILIYTILGINTINFQRFFGLHRNPFLSLIKLSGIWGYYRNIVILLLYMDT